MNGTTNSAFRNYESVWSSTLMWHTKVQMLCTSFQTTTGRRIDPTCKCLNHWSRVSLEYCIATVCLKMLKAEDVELDLCLRVLLTAVLGFGI